MAIAPAIAAENHAEGWLPDQPEDVARFSHVQIERGVNGTIADTIDLSGMLPSPGDQRDLGSCTTWAAVYGASSYYARLETRLANIELSPAYVFNQMDHGKDQCKDAGADLNKVINFMIEKGAPLRETFPESRFCQSPEATRSAAQPIFRLRAASILAFHSDGNNHKSDQAFDLDRARQQLSKGNPIVIGLVTAKGLLDKLPAGAIYNAHPSTDPSIKHGGHAVVLVGYDDHKQAFKFLNSWGTAWGEGGYGWISYDSARTEIHIAAVLKGSVEPSQSFRFQVKPGPSGSDLVATSQCGLAIKVPTSSGGVEWKGYVGTPEELKTFQTQLTEQTAKSDPSQSQNVSFNIAVRPWPVCEALLILTKPLLSASLPQIRTLDGETTIKVGSPYALELKSPNYPSYLYAIYLQADGQAVNLLPKRGLIRAQVPPGTTIRLGDGSDGGGRFRASEPAGTEAVIALAARSPIQELDDLEQPGSRYFRIGFGKNPSEASDETASGDRWLLSVLKASLYDYPKAVSDAKAKNFTQIDEIPREISADVLQLTIER